MRGALTGLALLLAACAGQGGAEEGTAPPAFASCADAATYYDARAGEPLAAPPTFQPNRVIKPNSAVTMDYNPLRLNVYVDDAGAILKAKCG